VAYKIRDSGLRISACGVGIQIHISTPFFVHEIQQTFCDDVKKFCIIATKNAVLSDFFNALKITWHGGFKSLNGGRRESVNKTLRFLFVLCSTSFPFSVILNVANSKKGGYVVLHICEFCS
jgi:hypothetical protein